MSSSIFDQLDEEFGAAWQEGWEPAGARMSKETIRQLHDVIGDPYVRRKMLQSGGRIDMIHTSFGEIRLFEDDRIPEGKFIVLVTRPKRWYERHEYESLRGKLAILERAFGGGGTVLPNERPLYGEMAGQDGDEGTCPAE